MNVNGPAVGKDVVLVVDDAPETLSFIHDTLEQAGMEVLVALEGKQALTIAQRIKPDMILLDAMMPNMDGFETCRQLKALPALSNTPVLFMTGLNDTEHIVKGLEAGGVDYLVKPVRPDELIARMRVHLNNARKTRSAYDALDSAGQHLMTLNTFGLLLWATPQTYGLMARTGADESWQSTVLASQVRAWLAQDPLPNSEMKLRGLMVPLVLRFLGRDDHQNGLFKLEESRQEDEAGLLRAELGLTERESEVLFWIANGKTNREAAEILCMSPRTVNKHLEQIFPKLGVENRTAAAGVALRVLAKR